MPDSNSAIVLQASAQSESTGQGCAKGQDGTLGEGRTPGQGNTRTLSNVRSSACTISDTVLQSILPVQLRVKGINNVVQTYAFYDTGSTGCFIKDSIKDQLNCKGIETAIKLQTMHGTDTVKTFIVNGLVVADIHGNNDVVLPKVFTQKDIPVNHDQIPRYEMLKDWPHSSTVINKIPVYQPELDIGILIGSNCPTALQPLEVVPTSGYGPFAVRYLHGWTVNGPVHVKVSSNGVSCHRLLVSDVQHVTDCITVESIRKYFELDFSERDLGSVPGECGLSFEDTRFVKRCQDDIEFRDGHFQLPMPFRDPNVNLPNNKKQALSRAKWQRRKMKNSEDYRQQYTAFMKKLFEKGYAYKIPDDEVNKIPVWYLPHHAVFHPDDKGTIRSAKTKTLSSVIVRPIQKLVLLVEG
ncbi:uncharacterized protein [Palaemon carinicauda]|uniref:uncharacterized protein n=1 Tax=Palaemon carinicauda TaxID=392227 RepID=UPI0035B57D24